GGQRSLPGGLPAPVEGDEGQVTAGDQAEGDAEGRGPKEACHGQVGREVLLGSGSRVLPGKRVGDGAVVGAGAVVMRHLPPGRTLYAPPSRLL
ncbi:MAG: hypothetical protein ACK5E6_03160, partial [Cyanobacteriota bacterium]